MNELEQMIMELVVNGGDARSKAMEAIDAAKNGDFEMADVLLKECNEQLSSAHNKQTELIRLRYGGSMFQ